MKKLTSILLIMLMMATVMAGCRRQTPQESTHNPESTAASTTIATQNTTQPTQTEMEITGAANTESARILAKIWDEYSTEERFSSYGGTVEHSVSDAPGDLDMANTEELTARYLIPSEYLADLEEGASLVHLMNNNIFTGAVFRVREGTQLSVVAKALRENVQRNQWICGQPDRLLIAEVDGHLLMAFGSNDAMLIFRGKLNTVYTEGSILYDETITA